MLRALRRRSGIFSSMPAGKPGSSRRVNVDLSPQGKSRYPEAKVLARKGYVLPKATTPAQ